MILGHVGAGDEYSGTAHSLQLGQCQGTGAADDKVRCGQQLGHIVDVFLHFKALAGGEALFLLKVFEQLHAVLSGGVDVEHRLIFLLLP